MLNINYDDNVDDYVSESPYAELQTSCQYLDENLYNLIDVEKSNKLSIFSFNIQSLPAKFNELKT